MSDAAQGPALAMRGANEDELPGTGAPSRAAAAPRDKPKSRDDWILEARNAQVMLSTAARPSAQMFVRLAQAQRMVGDWTAAAATVRAGLKGSKATSGLLREQAEVAMAEGRWADAAASWEQSVALSADRPTPGAFIRWAYALQRQNAFKQALEVLARGLERHPENERLQREHADLVWTIKTNAVLAAAPRKERALCVHDVCEVFWSMENRLSLLSWQVDGIAPWPLLRMPLYYSVMQKLGLYDAPHPTLKGQREGADAWDDAFEAAWAACEIATPCRAPPHRAAVLMATRKVGGSEPYTAAIRAELGANALLLDVAPGVQAEAGSLPFLAYKELFRTRYRRVDLARPSRQVTLVCEQIWREVFESLGVDVGALARVCRGRLVDFDAIARGFRLFFPAYKVGTLYLTNAYGSTNRAVVHAARSCGVRVVEMQHGFISRYHLGYSWPGRPEVPYCPDELWSFGAFWPETTPLPKGMSHRVVGAPYVQELARAAGAITRDPRLVVFTSQGVIGRRLFDVALETARQRPDYRFIFRLHPNEALADYQTLMAAAPNVPENFSLSHGSPNIFALLAEAAIQVGVFSTTLFEGMALGTRTVVLDMAGVEYMRPAVARGDVLMVGDATELADKLDAAPLCPDPQYYYAEPPRRLL